MSNDASPPPSAQPRAWSPRPTTTTSVHADEPDADLDRDADPDAAESSRLLPRTRTRTRLRSRTRDVTATSESDDQPQHEHQHQHQHQLELENDDDDDDGQQGTAPLAGPSTATASQWPRESRRRRRRSRRKRNPGLVKKLAFVTHLLKSLDLVVFAELSALYYMECSMFRFALRILGQAIYLTPKDESFPLLMPASRIHILVVVVPNIICMLLHVFAALPQGPDFHNGYQHGGLIVDFIGQRPPASRLYYLGADVLILAVQCLMLSIHSDRESLRALLKTPKSTLPELDDAVAAADVLPARSVEDLDAEERGISRHAPDVMIEDAHGIELQPLGGSAFNDRGEPVIESGIIGDPTFTTSTTAATTTATTATAAAEISSSSAAADIAEAASGRDSPSDESSRTFLSDLMSSGNAIIGEYHVLHTLRTAATRLERTASSYSLQTVGYRATMAAIQARRRHASLQNPPAALGT